MKEFKKIFVLLIMFLMVCGFKSNTTFTINDDKSLNIEIELLISDNQVNDESHSVMSTKAQSYEDNGWKVVNINESGYTGYKVTKTLNNIDELNKYSEDINIANILDKNFDLTKLFKIERSFFKNTYTVKYNYLFDESKFLTKSSNLTPSTAQVVVVEAVTNPDEEENTNASDIFNVQDETILTYKVILPVSALDSNTSTMEDDNKTLTWKLVPTENNVISYSFEMYYKTKVLIVGIGSVVFFLIIIIVIMIIRRKNSSKEVLIHADYDPSIAGAIAETTTDQIPQAQGSLEIPEPQQQVVTPQDINNQSNNLMQ